MRFEKISKKAFWDSFPNGSEEEKEALYSGVKMPARATAGSAGYDIFAVTDVTIEPGKVVLIPTAMRVKLDPGFFLFCVPRSGLGFKFGMRMLNTVGVIDSDYYYAENEGHFYAKYFNPSDQVISIKKGYAFMQAIILSHALTEDDVAVGEQRGGLGSTDGSGDGRKNEK